MKKVLSLVLVIAMILSSMSFAFAGTFEDVTGDYEDAVNALVALGVVKGYEDGTFRPERTITRAELAKILVEALGYGNLVAGANSSFTDTQGHWANGYVAIAAGTGLVVGYPNGTFQPDKTVTYDEALTMVVRALGYTDAALKGTWPTNYKVKAIDLDLTDDVVMAKADADRGGVAQIIYNALEANLVTVDSDNNVVNETKVVDGKTENKILLDKIARYEKAYEVNTASVDPEDKNFASEVIDLTPYMYQSLKVYMNDDDQVVFVKGTNNLVLEGVLNATGDLDLTAKTITVEDAKEDDYEFDITTSTSFMMNGEELSTANRGQAGYTNVNVKVTLVANADDNDSLKSGVYSAKGVVVEKQTRIAQITDEYVTGKSRVDVFTLPENDDDEVDLENIVVTGDAESLDEIQEDDIVVEFKAYSGAKTKLVVSRDTVEGTVTRVDGTKTFYVDGVKYSLNGAVTISSLELGSEGTFFLDHNGKIAAFEGESGPSSYAVVVGVEPGKTKVAFGSVSVDDYPQIKLATEENETVVFDIYVKIKDKMVTDSAKIVDGTNTYNFLTSTAFSDTTAQSITYTGFTGLDDEDIAIGATGSTYNVKQLVKYKLNKDGQISEIELVGANKAFDEDSSNYVFASDAVIFDGTDSYAVVGEDRLKADGYALTAYNKDGEIVAMVTEDVKAGADSVYAYIDKVNVARNSAGEDVQLVVAYLNGAKVEYLTDEEFSELTSGSAVKGDAVNTVYALDVDGEVVTNLSTIASSKVVPVTVNSVSTSTNSLLVNQTRYFLTEDATILEISGTTGETEEIIDLYDIDDQNVTLYLDAYGDVAFITYVK